MSADPFRPVLGPTVLREIYDHVYAHDDHEVGGVLVGSLTERALPAVLGVIPALEAEGLRASVTFTQEAWAIIHRRLDEDFAGRQIVGWYHSHPGFGIFLSNADRFIHENFFSDHRQVAFVVDPQAGTEGLFHWDQGELVVLWEGRAGRRGTGRTPASPVGRRTTRIRARVRRTRR
jgi:proteasome lid subunit RPN8/RPN11